ncbi:sodium/glutamate symporter [Clostridium minihomine]|uniref:sodium/glutamate symporter n=1 Tax=Clostridium minihomine TaxID=2045012 RepID=UPI000C78903B|nr:sodium/glutamate symporter [Clostridium minihomine]
MVEVTFDVMQSCAIAALVVLLGRWMVKRSKFLQTYCIPGVIVCGLIVSIVLSLLRNNGVLIVNFDIKVLREFFMDIFFTAIGLTASYKLIKNAGGKLLLGITITTVGSILIQNIVGILLTKPLGLHPLLGLGLGSLSLMGGVGTAGAIAPLYEELGATNAVVISVMGATFGMIFASLVGGPVSRWLIKRHKLSANVEEVDASKQGGENALPLNAKSMMGSVALVIISAGLGSYIALAAGMIPAIEFPYFVGCMLGGVIIRNILDLTSYEVREAEVDALGSITLDLFIAMIMMTIDVTKLASVAGPFVVILACQIILMALWVAFVTFNLCGKDYNAAVMTAAHVGIGLGSGPNAMANMRAVISEYGPANVAWVVFTPFALIVLDIFNPIFCTVVAPWVASLW